MEIPELSHKINDSFYKYISENSNCGDTTKLLLKNENVEFDKKFAILQIECRNKTKTKLPEILRFEKFLFPKSISSEQCTHEIVSKFHASLFNADDSVLDLTMGLGIDSYYISRNAKRVVSVELDKEIYEVGKYNYNILAKNIDVLNANSEDFVKSCNEKFSKVFIDPARRDNNNKRMFGFGDCQPNVLDMLPDIARIADTLIIKASPMLDISKSLSELKYVSDVWIIAVKNSCKELLFKLDFKQIVDTEQVKIHTINFDKTIQIADFQHINKNSNTPENAYPKENDILLEPNVCIMKSGKAEQLSVKFDIQKISCSSHLFLSTRKTPDFPGRQFVICEIIPFKDKELKRLKRYKELNVATRNFKLTADQLKNRLRVKDGGDKYLFGTTLESGEMVLLMCDKVD